MRLSQPFLIRSIILFLNSETRNKGWDSTFQAAIIACFGLVLTTIFLSWSWHFTFLTVIRVGCNLRTALTTLIYQKILRVSKSSLEITNTGKMLNVIATDLQKFEDLSWNFAYLFIGPLMSIVVISVTYLYLGIACVGGLSILLLWIPLQFLMGKLFSKFKGSTAKATDSRIKIMAEIISSVKFIKVNAWEASFAKMVDSLRRKEISEIKKTALLKATNSALFLVATRIMVFASLIIYVMQGHSLDAEMVFVVMSLFNAIRLPVTNYFPNAVGLGAEALVVIRRVKDILLLHEVEMIDQKEDSPKLVSNGKIALKRDKIISLSNMSAKWTKSSIENHLKDITTEIKGSTLNIICGPVGSGKSCFLNTLLQETHLISPASSRVISGSISYCPQESWCFSGSIKENILFGSSYDESKFIEVTNACGLQRDFTLFPHGSETSIGEKGYTLSGGQKARVTLARAVYHDADIYLLDDPLSAVDPKVANHIFNQCMKQYLKDKCVILVTHQLQFLEDADNIIVLRDKELHSSGSYSELMASNVDFLTILGADDDAEEGGDANTKSKKKKKIMPAEQIDDGEERPKTTKTDKNADNENKASGSVSGRVYWQYFTAGGSVLSIIIVALITLGSQASLHFSDLWLTAWTKSYDQTLNQSVDFTHMAEYISNVSETNIITYSSLSLGIFASAIARTVMLYALCLASSINLHDKVFKCILSTRMSFFENNPIGRILNRFTRDMGTVDQQIPASVVLLNLDIINSIGIIAVSMYLCWYLVFPCIVLFSIAIPVRNYYLRTARDLQRLDAIGRSPVYSHLATSADGLPTIRAMGKQEQFLSQFIILMNDSVATHWLVLSSGKAIGFVLDAISSVYITFICILLMVVPRDGSLLDDATAGLLLSSSLLLLGSFQYAIRVTADFENQMVSVERVVEYTDLLPEEAVKNYSTPSSWPSRGDIFFENVNLRYDADLVLKNINFHIGPGEKIGIVGRTGAGKSSLISVLFRLADFEGNVFIDRKSTKSLSLDILRSALSIIPQDPVLFTGSIRSNLDPFGSYEDEQLWEALNDTRLRDAVNEMDGGLNAFVAESGSNLSVGQRQLLCLSRAVLKKNKIIILDEATANVDHETDRLIQETISSKFASCTVLTIAHRLNTIIQCNRVLVLDAGSVLEFDHPFRLLQNPDGAFSSMVNQTSDELSSMLKKLAEDSFENFVQKSAM